MFAVGVVNIGVGGAQMFGWSQFLFPGCNIALAYTLAAIPLLFHALLYSIMGSSMPRSGGDYVWVSRIAHPALGFTVNWMFIAYLTVAVGSIMSYFSYVGLSQLFWIVGTLQNNSSLLALSQLAATPPWMLGFGILLTIAVAILLQFPTQKVFKLLWVCFIIALLGWFTIMALLATSSLSDFQAGFLYYTGTSYQNIITSATAAGYSYAPNFGQTIAALPLAFLTYSGYVTIAYAAGEIKQVKKSLLYSIPGSLLFGWVIYSATAVLLDNTVGMQFLGSIGQLVFGSPATEPYTYSYITFIGSVLTRNVFVAGWICIAFIFWIIIIGVTNMFYITRCIFAWSFDRVVPTIFAHMNDRFNTPTYAVLVGAVGYIVGLVLTTYTPIGVFMNFGLGMSVAYLITGIVCAAFPFIKKEMYRNSPLKGPTVGGVPFVTICGLVTAAFFALLIYLMVGNAALSGPVGGVQWIAVVANIVFCFAVYYISRAYHMRQGIDIARAFEQIPPE